MGSKLTPSIKDSFFDDDEIDDELDTEIAGIVAGCYCCSQNIHVTFEHLEHSPVAQIDDSFFYIFICDQCEDDIMVLRESGIKQVSYDAVWLMQENLYTELSEIATEEGAIDTDLKDAILIRLYREAERTIASKTAIRSRGLIPLDGKKKSTKN